MLALSVRIALTYAALNHLNGINVLAEDFRPRRHAKGRSVSAGQNLHTFRPPDGHVLGERVRQQASESVPGTISLPDKAPQVPAWTSPSRQL